MKRLIVVALTLAVAIPALAGGNPNVAAYLTYDASGAADYRRDLGMFDEFDVYLCVKNIDTGFKSITVAVVPDVDVTTGLSWTVLIPGGLALGDWAGDGVTITGSGCVTDDVIVIASGNTYFKNIAGEIKIQDHADYPRWVVDCEDAIDNYCHESNVGLLMDPVPTGEDCTGASPVEDATWGGIKALYR